MVISFQRYVPIPKVSRRRRREGRFRTRCNQAVFERAEGWCELRIDGVCLGRATTTHEIVPRARGCSIVDPENCKGACAACHRWVHEHPAAAREMGFLKSAHEGKAHERQSHQPV